MILRCYDIMILREGCQGAPGAARPNALKKRCRTELLSHVILTRSQCHTAAAEGAKLSTINPALGSVHARRHWFRIDAGNSLTIATIILWFLDLIQNHMRGLQLTPAPS